MNTRPPIKTLHLTNAYHPSSGGISTWYRALMDAAEKLERPFRLIVPGEQASIENIGNFCRIYTLKAQPSPFFDSRYRLLLPNLYLKGSSSSIGEILIEEQPDIIETCDKYALNWLSALVRESWFRNLNRATLIGMSCERMDDNLEAYVRSGILFTFVSRFYMRWMYTPFFDFHIANSIYTAEELRAAANRKHPRQIVVCPPGVDFNFFSKNAVRDRQRWLPKNVSLSLPLILYAGRLSPEKNLELLIKTIEELITRRQDTYHFIIAGSGPLENSLKEQILGRFHSSVTFLGHVQREELPNLYSSCDVFVHCNPKEPFGIAPLEAMASGCAVIVPDQGGVLTYANETNAFLAKPDPSSFANAIEDAVRNTEVTKSKKAEAFRTAMQFDNMVMAEKLFEVYETIHYVFQRSLIRKQINSSSFVSLALSD